MTRLLAMALGVGTMVLTSIPVARSAVPDLAGARAAIGAMGVPFVPNVGQWDREAAFGARTLGGTLFITTEGKLVYSLAGKPGAPDDGEPMASTAAARTRGNAATARAPGWVLTESFIGAKRQPLAVHPYGSHPRETRVSYFVGGSRDRRAFAGGSYERVELGEVFPGVDVQLRATGTNVEKIFTVAPARDPAGIRLRLDGATALELAADGALIAHTGNGPVTYTAPIAYQEDAHGRRTAVDVHYKLDRSTATYGFAVGRHDSRRPLIIDPFLQATYLGAAGDEQVNAMAIHPLTGEVYVTGFTTSSGSTFPGVNSPGPGAQTSYGLGAHDAFVSRFNASLTALLQSTYLGAAGDDQGNAIAIHPLTGEVYVGGRTSSTGSTFPGVANGAQSTLGNFVTGAFVSRFNAALTVLLQSTYLAADFDFASVNAMAIPPASGEVYVAGSTASALGGFPGVAGGAQPGYGGGPGDGFVSRLNAGLTAVLQSTYLGGTGADDGIALAIHPATGDIYVAGNTGSADFPGRTGGAQPALASGQDVFVSRLNPNLTALLQSTYLGTTIQEILYALAIHPATGEVYVTGTTTSMAFPGVAGGAIPGPLGGGLYKSFVSRFNAGLTSLVQSTYLGGNTTDGASALAIHPATGEVYVAGSTNSETFPGMTSPGTAAQSIYGGSTGDGFVTRFNAELTALNQSTYYGGLGFDQVKAMTIHPGTGEVYTAGFTNGGLPGTTNGAQSVFGGAALHDGFVSRHTLDLRNGSALPAPFAFGTKFGAAPGSLQTSAPATISGMTASPQTVALLGGNLAQYCVSTAGTCDCQVRAFDRTAGPVANGQAICVRQYAPPLANAAATATVFVGGGQASFTVATIAAGCTLDVDGNGSMDALTDGLIIIRALFGLTGTAVTNNAIGNGATRMTWAQLQPYLNGNCGTNFAP